MIKGLCLEDIRLLFNGYRVELFDKIDSTNDEAIRQSRGDGGRLLDRTIYISKLQESGRGTKGRSWFSPTGMSLYTSILIYPGEDFDPSILAKLPVRFGELVRDVLLPRCRKDVEIKVKSPNDILIDGKKVMGILCESSTLGGKVNHIVIGVGMNLVKPSEDIPSEIENTIGFLEESLKPGEDILKLYRDAIVSFEGLFE